MSKVIGYRVVVEPRSTFFFEHDEGKRLSEYRHRCSVIVEDIKRHVDYVGSVEIEEITEESGDEQRH